MNDTIEIRSGSILDFEGDCIVNPANSFMRHGAGLAAAIDKAARGISNVNAAERREQRGLPYVECHNAVLQWDHDRANTPLTATGNVAVTSAGVLPFKGIIHAVGPIWNGGMFIEADLLDVVTATALDAALERDWKSIAFPAISCGIFGFPVDQAARILLEVADSFSDNFDLIAFYPFGHELVFEDARELAGI